MNRPVRSACTSKSNVCTLFPGVGEPVPIWPLPITSPVADCALHVTAKVVVAVPPAGTVTVRGFAPLTVQFQATPDSAIEWSPPRPGNVTPPLGAVRWLAAPPAATVL